jgi:hypothetical protein
MSSLVRGVVGRGVVKWLVLHYGHVLSHAVEVGGLLGSNRGSCWRFCVLLSYGEKPFERTGS